MAKQSTARKPDRSAAFEARRLDLLRQVAIAFAEDGYSQTSVGGLAERLGVSKPVLYYYAKNKDDLLYQSMMIASDEIMAGLDRANALRTTGLAKLRGFFYSYAEIMCGDFGRCVAMVDHRVLDEPTRDKVLHQKDAIESGVRRIIEEGQADGSIADRDVKLITHALFGVFNSIPSWFDKSGRLDFVAVVESYMDIFAAGIAKSARPKLG